MELIEERTYCKYCDKDTKSYGVYPATHCEECKRPKVEDSETGK